MDLLLPVRMTRGRWGLAWAEEEPDPRLGFDEWPERYFNRLYFAEWTFGGWTGPKEILSADLRISWEGARAMHFSPARGTVIMTIVRDGLGASQVVCGSPEEGFRPVPVGQTTDPFRDGVTPVWPAFVLSGGHRATAVVLVRRRIGDHTTRELLMLEEGEREHTWSSPQVIWELPPGGIEGLRVHRDGMGTLHVLWGDGMWGGIRHLVRRDGQDAWAEEAVPAATGTLVHRVSGIDRCGNPALVRQVPRSMSDIEIQLSRWDGSWSEFSSIAADQAAFDLFDGLGEEQSWHFGWSAFRTDRPEPLGTIRLARP